MVAATPVPLAAAEPLPQPIESSGAQAAAASAVTVTAPAEPHTEASAASAAATDADQLAADAKPNSTEAASSAADQAAQRSASGEGEAGTKDDGQGPDGQDDRRADRRATTSTQRPGPSNDASRAEGASSREPIAEGSGPNAGTGSASRSGTATPAAPAVERAREVQAAIDAERGANTASKRGPEGSKPVDAAAGRAGESLDGRAIDSLLGRGQPAAGEARSRSDATANHAASSREESDAPSPLVGRGLAALAQQRGGTLTMRLDPPTLGEVRITMTIKQGTVSAEIAPSSAIAHDLLGADLTTLKSALERQGLVVDRITLHAPPPASRSDAPATPAPAAHAGEQRSDGSSQQERGDRQQGFRHDAGGGASRGRDERPEGQSGDGRGQRQRRGQRFETVWAGMSGE